MPRGIRRPMSFWQLSLSSLSATLGRDVLTSTETVHAAEPGKHMIDFTLSAANAREGN